MILAPGAPTEATPLTDTLSTKYHTPLGDLDYLNMLRIHFQANIAAIPALGVPCGFSQAKLPLSLAIFGTHFDEATVYRVGHAYEQATEWRTRQPSAIA